jgi:hypothetical protein
MPAREPRVDGRLAAELKAGVPPGWVTAICFLGIAGFVAGLMVTCIDRIPRGSTGDFEHFYFAAVAARGGGDIYAAHTQGYIYPPLLAFLWEPLGRLSWHGAAGVMLAVNVAATLAAGWLAAGEMLRRFGGPVTVYSRVSVLLVSLLLVADKVKGEWQMWQTDVWMLLLFVVALVWLDRRPWLAGAALGLAVNIKYLPLLFVPYLIVRRRWGAARWLALFTLGFAVLPAVQRGWSRNVSDWRVALEGIFAMTGAKPVGNLAPVHAVTDGLSCSITSALSRGFGPAGGFAVATGIGIAVVAGLMGLYRRCGVPVFGIRTEPVDRFVTAAEWAGLLALVLAFSPQTNTRHLYDSLLLTTAAVALAAFGPGRTPRVPLIAACVVLAGAFVFPLGSRRNEPARIATLNWLRWGGPCWALLAAGVTVAAAAAVTSRRLPRETPV